MQFTQLQSHYKYDTLAEAIYQREIEWFHYDFDIKNFTQIAANMQDGPDKEHMINRIAETRKQMSIVENIYNALLAQVDDQVAYAAAVERAIARRNG